MNYYSMVLWTRKPLILGYFIAQIKIFLICLTATIVWALVCIRQLNLALQPEIALIIFFLTLLMTTQLISFGILFAALSRKRTHLRHLFHHEFSFPCWNHLSRHHHFSLGHNLRLHR